MSRASALGIVGLSILVLFVSFLYAQAGLPITPDILQNISWEFQVDQSLASGKKLNLEGAAGDSYVARDTDAASMDSYNDGTLGWSVIGGMLQPPPCPADLSSAPPGFCLEAATGKIRHRGTLEAIP